MRDIEEVLNEQKSDLEEFSSMKSSVAYVKKITLLFEHDLCELTVIEDKDKYKKDSYLTTSLTFKGKRFFLYYNITTLKKAFFSKIFTGENKGKYFLIVEQEMRKEEFTELKQFNQIKKNNSGIGAIAFMFFLFLSFIIGGLIFAVITLVALVVINGTKIQNKKQNDKLDTLIENKKE